MTSPPRVVVTVGTDHHPFPRLLGWVTELVAAGVLDGTRVFVQHGASPAPIGVVARDRLPREELVARMTGADLVVGQAGPGTVLDARRAGRVPVVVPRLARFGEAVDDHQVAFARHLGELGLAHVTEDREAFAAAVARAAADPTGFAVPPGAPRGADPELVGERLAAVAAQVLAGRRPSVLRRGLALLRVRGRAQSLGQPSSRPSSRSS